MTDGPNDGTKANNAPAQCAGVVITAIICALCLIGAAGFAFERLSGWPATILAGILRVVPGLLLAIQLPLQIAHFVFRKWPPTITAPDGRVISVPPDGWERPPREWWQWFGRIVLLAVTALLFVADRPALAGAYLFLFVTGPVNLDMMVVKQAGWDRNALPPFARARYAVLAGFYPLLWQVLRIPLFALRTVGWGLTLIFSAVAVPFAATAKLYEDNVVARRIMQVCIWVFALPVLVVIIPFLLIGDVRAGRRDGRDVCAVFQRPAGLVYLLYAEPHQYEFFLGDRGVLADIRDSVVARDWRKDIQARIDEYGSETFREMPEGRMLARLDLSNMRDDLPTVIVARPGKWVRVFRLSGPYRRRRRDGGKSLENEISRMRRSLKWALTMGVAAPQSAKIRSR